MNTNESAILSALQAPAVILDKNGKIACKNRKWDINRDKLSLSGNKFKGDNFIEHCSLAAEKGNDYALRLLFGIREVLNNQKDSFSLRISTSFKGQNGWYQVEISPIKFQSGNYLLVVFNNVTENFKTIQQLRESEALYKQNFKYSAAGIIFGKENGEILNFNPAACKILGYTESELMEGGHSLFVDEDETAHREVVKTRNEKSIFQGEKEYKHKNGQYIPVQLTSIRFKTDDNKHRIINTFQNLQSVNKKTTG
jgi:PAS domain S-box-containing protein